MKKQSILVLMFLGILVFVPSVTRAQGGAKRGPEVTRDPDMEKESLHNLEVAQQYFKLRKAYVGALERCEEVLAGNPTFSRIDEILYMAGVSSLNLADAKGKQKPDLYVIREAEKKTTLTPQEFRDKARDYLSQLVNDYPQSKFRDEAMSDLKSVGGPKPKSGGPAPEMTAKESKVNRQKASTKH
jgi:outer membrane protein assembly factor BamD (BamD/ComL family)